MTGSAVRRPRLDQGLAALTADKDLVLCDVWGVIHNGVVAYEAAVDALRRFRWAGGTVVLVTNAPVPAASVRARLDRLEIGRDAYDDIATAGDVAISTLAAEGCPPIFNIGPAEDVAIYRELARISGHEPALVDVDGAALAVCLGLDHTGVRPEDYDDVLARLKTRNLRMICANPDIVVEVGDDLIYCAGAIAERYERIGGDVVQTGKPHAAIYERAYDLAAKVAGPIERSRVLAIGDAVATDLAGAAGQGIAAAFITAGIHRAELHGPLGDQPLDRSALALLLGSRGAAPEAALTRLTWEPGGPRPRRPT